MHLVKSLSYNLNFEQNDCISIVNSLQVIADTDLDHILEQAEAMAPSY